MNRNWRVTLSGSYPENGVLSGGDYSGVSSVAHVDGGRNNAHAGLPWAVAKLLLFASECL
jgi:hypothetical protein